MYVAVKGGERAIDNAHLLLAKKRRGDTSIPELSVEQVREQMPLAVARVMSEGSLYDPQLAALAIKQAAGDLMEAIFLLRAYRTTLPRFGASAALDTTQTRGAGGAEGGGGGAKPAGGLLFFPAGRAGRLQALARGDEGFLLALG